MWVAFILVIATSGPPQMYASETAFPNPVLCQDDLAKAKPVFARRFPGALISGRCEKMALEMGI